jgi:membrane-associated phospholipid phosphatase
MPMFHLKHLRPAEWVTASYLAITGVIAAAWGGPAWPIVAAHAIGVVAVVGVLPRLPDLPRDWIPVALVPLLYLEVGLINQFITTGFHDAAILSLEHDVFGRSLTDALRGTLPWRPLAGYFEFGYLAFYALLPMLGIALYRNGDTRDYRRMLGTVLTTFYICFLCFVCFPVAGPWYARAHSDGLTDMLLTHGSSKGAAFPSSHVAAAVVIWLFAWRYHRRVFWAMAAIVPALVFGTVYGGYHYGVDALAGLVLAVGVYTGDQVVWLRVDRVIDPLRLRRGKPRVDLLNPLDVTAAVERGREPRLDDREENGLIREPFAD